MGSGADWSVVRTDGVVETDAHYMFETDDGGHQVHNRGYIYNTLPTRLDRRTSDARRISALRWVTHG
jgi:hypothetical protein